jgi:hypothetical protein
LFEYFGNPLLLADTLAPRSDIRPTTWWKLSRNKSSGHRAIIQINIDENGKVPHAEMNTIASSFGCLSKESGVYTLLTRNSDSCIIYQNSTEGCVSEGQFIEDSTCKTANLIPNNREWRCWHLPAMAYFVFGDTKAHILVYLFKSRWEKHCWSTVIRTEWAVDSARE